MGLGSRSRQWVPEQLLALRDCFITKANAILTSTLGPGGGFLDGGSVLGIYARLDLHTAAGKAAALAAGRPPVAE